jgi:4-hydroxy-tetrahydrodipicolinate synthase
MPQAANHPHRLYHGIAVPMLMPFNQDKSIEWSALEKLTDWLTRSAVSILFPMGGSGEFGYLTIPERKQIIDTIARVNQKQKLLIAGTGAATLAETLELSQYAEKAGADGIGVIIPSTLDGTQQAIYDYYAAIEKATSLPFMIYDPVGEGPCSPTPEIMRKMVDDFSHLVAIKYRTLNGERMGCMSSAVGEDISILSGSETVFLGDLSLGVVGCVGGGGNFYPELMASLQDFFNEGDIHEARRIQFRVLQAIDVLNRVYWPLSGKIVLQEMGIPYQLVTRVPEGTMDRAGIAAIRAYYKEWFKK